MKKLYIVVALLSIFCFSGCSSKQNEPYYDRANKASSGAQNQLSKD